MIKTANSKFATVKRSKETYLRIAKTIQTSKYSRTTSVKSNCFIL